MKLGGEGLLRKVDIMGFGKRCRGGVGTLGEKTRGARRMLGVGEVLRRRLSLIHVLRCACEAFKVKSRSSLR